MGRVAKTDRLDAEMLARMGRALQLKPTQTHSEVLGDLRELLVFRRGLIKDRTAAKTRLKTSRQKMLRGLLTQRLGQIERHLARVDAAMKAIVASDPDLADRLEILISIPGISTTSAIALLADMPELGALTGKQAAALAGLAPLSHMQEHVLPGSGSRVSQANGRGTNGYRAAGRPSGKGYSCRRFARSSTTGQLVANSKTWSEPENRARSP